MRVISGCGGLCRCSPPDYISWYGPGEVWQSGRPRVPSGAVVFVKNPELVGCLHFARKYKVITPLIGAHLVHFSRVLRLRSSNDFRVAKRQFLRWQHFLWLIFVILQRLFLCIWRVAYSQQALRERLNNRQDLGEAMADTVRLGEGPHWKQCLTCSILVLCTGLKSELTCQKYKFAFIIWGSLIFEESTNSFETQDRWNEGAWFLILFGRFGPTRPINWGDTTLRNSK